MDYYYGLIQPASHGGYSLFFLFFFCIITCTIAAAADGEDDREELPFGMILITEQVVTWRLG